MQHSKQSELKPCEHTPSHHASVYTGLHSSLAVHPLNCNSTRSTVQQSGSQLESLLPPPHTAWQNSSVCVGHVACHVSDWPSAEPTEGDGEGGTSVQHATQSSPESKSGGLEHTVSHHASLTFSQVEKKLKFRPQSQKLLGQNPGQTSLHH